MISKYSLSFLVLILYRFLSATDSAIFWNRSFITANVVLLVSTRFIAVGHNSPLNKQTVFSVHWHLSLDPSTLLSHRSTSIRPLWWTSRHPTITITISTISPWFLKQGMFASKPTLEKSISYPICVVWCDSSTFPMFRTSGKGTSLSLVLDKDLVLLSSRSIWQKKTWPSTTPI